jgi:hypothetical protein
MATAALKLRNFHDIWFFDHPAGLLVGLLACLYVRHLIHLSYGGSFLVENSKESIPKDYFRIKASKILQFTNIFTCDYGTIHSLLFCHDYFCIFLECLSFCFLVVHPSEDLLTSQLPPLRRVTLPDKYQVNCLNCTVLSCLVQCCAVLCYAVLCILGCILLYCNMLYCMPYSTVPYSTSCSTEKTLHTTHIYCNVLFIIILPLTSFLGQIFFVNIRIPTHVSSNRKN